MEAEVDYQVAAPAETRTPNWHRAKKSLNKECGWKDGDRGGLAQDSKTHLGKNKTVLTRTGLLMEGVETLQGSKSYLEIRVEHESVTSHRKRNC
jgi:hypothetical protein